MDKIIQNLKPPSKLRYAFFGFFAAIGDIIDLANLTGFGILFSFIADIIIAPILLFAGFSANSRIKAMEKTAENINSHIERIGRRLIQARRYYAGALKTARKIPGLRRSIRKTALALRSARLKIARNPLFKNMAAVVADLIPFLDLLPWRTIAIYLTYKDEKKAYEETLENANLALAAENQITQHELEARRELLAA